MKMAPKYFHISRQARDKYKFQRSFFAISGSVVFADFQAVRQFTQQLKDNSAKASDINSMGLIHEVFHHMIDLFQKQINPAGMKKALLWLEKKIGADAVNQSLLLFTTQFPPDPVFLGTVTVQEYLNGETDHISHRQLLLEEMLLLWLGNVNPAQKKYKKLLFDDAPLIESSAYGAIIEHLERFFQGEPLFGPDQMNLIALLRSPAIAVPDSLSGQLGYIRREWGVLLGDLLDKLLQGLDLIKEEEKSGSMGPGEIPVYDFSHYALSKEYERFTADHHWMPCLVLMAKSSYVWLDQLSKKYDRHIHRLDQVPDEELDILASRGFSGLWLIGLWERSRASEQIKRICGNPEAVASAYSVYEYRIADSLGGEAALYNLKHRAWQRGLRMASDMVPNHMGIDSPWVVEHPDWFLSLPYCPYPAYSFNGVNLSTDSRVSIFLEDHYYDRTDAAVVFKWVNNHSGEVRYMYHGNDGTSMPWNDTAQLNYLNPETREAVTRTIFSVAEMFPVIRFDAAMTLTQKHYQRLWFPEPGSGGDIPTRAGNGLATPEFLKQMPEEFWRQVVDRFAQAQSDTLLLAEAFWMMEPYFVRTLGMHRVYNSAFMNFLKNEDNAQFRTSIINVLQFNREIMKRFVNFMNNPDEETAVAQFGKDDKYFGVCTVMATLPGLPMFGHGQLEGFKEKYGMEYCRAYWDEIPDSVLLERHEREIFPLLRQRYIFAEVEHFLFYDFYTAQGQVDENVIAYSNRWENRSSLVLYHNKFAETAGWVKESVFYSINTGEPVHQKNLGEGLGLSGAENSFVIFRDHDSGLEYIRRGKELCENGLYVELKAFKKNVFLDFHEVTDNGDTAAFAPLTEMLGGQGVPSIHQTMLKFFLNPVKKPFQNLLELRLYVEAQPGDRDQIEKRLAQFLVVAMGLLGNTDTKITPEEIAIHTCQKVAALPFSEREPDRYPALIIQELMGGLAQMVDEKNKAAATAWAIAEEWLLLEDMVTFLAGWEIPMDKASQLILYIRLVMQYPQWQHYFALIQQDRRSVSDEEIGMPSSTWLDTFFDDPLVQQILRVNRHNDILWFQKEAAEDLFYWLFTLSTYGMDVSNSTTATILSQSDYRLEKLKEKLVFFIKS